MAKTEAAGIWKILPTATALLAAGLIAVYSLWYTSAGEFPTLPPIQNDYVDLGDAFLHGQLSLREQPDPRLAALSDPYDFNQRGDIPIHWDASYYEGKYFLYWGPAPALVSAAIELFSGSVPSGAVLVLIPYLGLLIVVGLLLFDLTQAGPFIQRATVGLFLLIGFFSFPMLYTLGQPRHYQSSILFGQFFLMGGLLCFLKFTRSGRAAWLVPAGLGWGLALAARYNLAISIGVFVLGAIAWLWRDRRLSRAALLLGPLALCAAGLGLYNYARFGNALETGLSYQLTIPELREMSYARAYVPSGLYIYGVYHLNSAPEFPFIQSWHFSPRNLPEWLFIPRGRQYDQVIFGLVDTAPGLWLSVLGLPLLALLVLRRGRDDRAAGDKASASFIFIMLALASAGQIAFLLVFFYLAERYLVDFYVPVVVCIAIVLWWLDATLERLPALRLILWLAAGLLAAWTVAIAYFATFGVPTLVSAYFDPNMVAGMTQFWNRFLPAGQVVIQALP